MRFWRGFIPLNPIWTETIEMARNVSNNTNITSLDDFPDGVLLGEPIIGLLEPEFEEGQKGVTEDPFLSTMAELEIQFKDGVEVTFDTFTKTEIIVDEWVSDVLWVDEKCFTDGKFPRYGLNLNRKLVKNWSITCRKFFEKFSKIDRKLVENWSKIGRKLN